MKRNCCWSLWLLLAIALLGAAPGKAATPPASFAYILQADAFAKSRALAVSRLAACGRDWLVLDPEFSHGERWTRADLDALRAGHAGRQVLAYLSIGEAEDYRPYWSKEWGAKGKLTAAAPAWLGAENPQWKGNYKVQFWHADWQRLLLGAVGDAMRQGFDGVYMDIVDAFEFFELVGSETVDDRVNAATKQTYRRDMVEWVKLLAAHARALRAGAWIIPQNGAQLLAHADFAVTVSGLGLEDTFTDTDKLQPRTHTDYVRSFLKPLRDAGKPVLAIEYPRTEPKREQVRRSARAEGFTWLLVDRPLKTLGESGR